MTDDWDEYPYEEDEPVRPRDPKVGEAKKVLLSRYFHEDGSDVYYARQLEIWLERNFYHWITKKALNELAQERKIKFERVEAGRHMAHFFWPRKHRYPRRQIREILGLIGEFSDPTFTRALGKHGELLTDAAFARVGFRIIQSKVRDVDGRRWIKSNHDLDRIVERDGVRYGVEI